MLNNWIERINVSVDVVRTVKARQYHQYNVLGFVFHCNFVDVFGCLLISQPLFAASVHSQIRLEYNKFIESSSLLTMKLIRPSATTVSPVAWVFVGTSGSCRGQWSTDPSIERESYGRHNPLHSQRDCLLGSCRWGAPHVNHHSPRSPERPRQHHQRLRFLL